MERVRVVDGDARLIGACCTSCGHATFPRRDRCPACRAGSMEETLLGPDGSVESAITLHVSTDGIDAPYAVGLIRLREGPVVLSRILGDAGAGTRVQVLADAEADAFWFAPVADDNAASRPHAA
jgi:uncharacterized OB-fold protein